MHQWLAAFLCPDAIVRLLFCFVLFCFLFYWFFFVFNLFFCFLFVFVFFYKLTAYDFLVPWCKPLTLSLVKQRGPFSYPQYLYNHWTELDETFTYTLLHFSVWMTFWVSWCKTRNMPMTLLAAQVEHLLIHSSSKTLNGK